MPFLQMVELLATVASLYMQVRTFGPLGTTLIGASPAGQAMLRLVQLPLSQRN